MTKMPAKVISRLRSQRPGSTPRTAFALAGVLQNRFAGPWSGTQMLTFLSQSIRQLLDVVGRRQPAPALRALPPSTVTVAVGQGQPAGAFSPSGIDCS